MPRRESLSAVQREALVALPIGTEEIALHYTLGESDLALIRQRRGAHNRLGFAIQLCYLRYPGIQLQPEVEPSAVLLKYVGQQLHIKPSVWIEYARRDETRREHALELLRAFGYRSFTVADYRQARTWLTELALQTNSAVMLAQQLVDELRRQRILLPASRMIDRLCVEALAREIWSRVVYGQLDGRRRQAASFC